MSAGIDWATLRTLDPTVDEWLVVCDEAGSTNDQARLLAARGAAHGTVVWALRQTAGRGRRGAAWFADEASLAFSVVLRPRAPRAWWPRLALVAGLAVAETLERYGVTAEVKWPNDVVVAGRKLCGILAEAGSGHVVLGIGINVNHTLFPAWLTELATSLRLACGHEVARELLLAESRASLLFLADEAERDFAAVLLSLAERCALRGKRVRMLAAGQVLVGVVKGFAPDGSLWLETDLGLKAVVQADELRVVEC